VSVPQVPESTAELEAMIAGGILVEGLAFDAKAMIEPGDKGNRSLAIDVAAMAVSGGLIVIGIREEGDGLIPEPVVLAGLRERISQVARNRIDPPVELATAELPGGRPGMGFVLVTVPPSPLAPHQVDGQYRGRGDSTNHVMGDAEVRRIHSARIQSRPEMRVGLVEQLENCRRWLAADPARGAPARNRLRRMEPRLEAVRTIVDRVDLAPGLAVMLIWQMGAIADLWRRIDDALDAIGRTLGGQPNTARAQEVADLWPVMLERLQVLAALLSAEGVRAGQVELATTHDGAPWTTVPERPPQWRALQAIGDRQDGIPPFPPDPAFDRVRPEDRDRAGAATGARQQADLADAAHAGVQRAFGRQ
jgi:hypothetical protein